MSYVTNLALWLQYFNKLTYLLTYWRTDAPMASMILISCNFASAFIGYDLDVRTFDI